MPKRGGSPIILREFQADTVDVLANAMIDTIEKIKAAPARRREITRRAGCALLEAPTASGKTVMLAATAERISTNAPVVWFWFAPFKGVVDQTTTAMRGAAPGLRVRDPKTDRVAIGTRPGDVFIATWASVAATNKDTRKMRVDDDELPALDNLVTQLRTAGMILGAVIDEAHHTFKPNTQAFKFYQEILRPDLLMLATATPDDSDVEILRRMLDIDRFQRVSVSRDRVVEARLNKKSVKAISFVAKGTNEKLLDLNEVALRKAVDQHKWLKAEMKAAGIAMVPLLLVQAASTSWNPGRVKEFLTKHLGFSETSVGVHTADEPDPDVQALANDPNVEVLVFKMAVATGFDAPRASTLCALRPVQDRGFGLQVIGRIMRVHPLLQKLHDLPAAFDTGYVFLGDAESQLGLQQAANQVRSLKNLIEVSTDRVEIYIAAAGENGEITVEDERGQRVLVLTSPDVEDSGFTPTPARDYPHAAEPKIVSFADTAPLFGLLAEASGGQRGMEPRAAALANAGASATVRALPQKAFNYPMRLDVTAPKRLRTEKMPRDMQVLVDELIRNVAFNADHLNMVRQQRAEIERRETDLFDAAQSRRTADRAEISDLFAKHNALQFLRVSDYIDPQDLARRLLKKLEQALENAGQDVPEQRTMRRALNVILVRQPNLCREALKRAMVSCAEVVDADDLPEVWGSDDPLQESPLNLYGCRPADLNRWESEFADWLDRQASRVIWWTRNLQTHRIKDDWGVRIVLPETGKGYYPDFIICVDGRRKLDRIALAETKERIESLDSASKSRTEHREYGKAVMVTYDASMARFIRVEFDASLDRNKPVAELDINYFVSE